jgi:hypothetical protein
MARVASVGVEVAFKLLVVEGVELVALLLFRVLDAGQCSDHRSSHGVGAGRLEADVEVIWLDKAGSPSIPDPYLAQHVEVAFVYGA